MHGETINEAFIRSMSFCYFTFLCLFDLILIHRVLRQIAKDFLSLEEIRVQKSVTAYGAYHLYAEWTEGNHVKPPYCQYPGLLPKQTYTHNFGAQLNTVDNKANSSSYVAVCNYCVLLLRN
jgi:hypothetical protein